MGSQSGPTTESSRDRGASLQAAGAESAEVASLINVYQTQLIVAAAMLEGGAFFCIVAYMLEGQAIARNLAIVLIFMLALQVPMVSQVESWIEREISTRRQLRQLQ
jgi:hypothetical protein